MKTTKSATWQPLLFTIFVISFSYFHVYAAVPDYGENNTALGQVVDEFANSDFLNVTVDVIRNATLQAVELNYTAGGISFVYENYSAMIEVDIGANRLTVNNDTRYTVTNLDLDEEVYLYRDLGAGSKWDDFTGMVDVLAKDYASNDEGAFFSISQEIDDYHNTQEGIVFRLRHNIAPDAWQIILSKIEGGALTNDAYLHTDSDKPTWFYFSFNRSGANVYLAIYDDAARTSLLDTLTVTLTNATIDYQYLYGMNSRNRALGARALDFEGYNLRFLQGIPPAYELSGYATTNNLMANETGGTLSNLLNVTMSGNHNVTVEYSDDNSTWVDNENNTGFVQCVNGLQTIELRFLNFTTLYQRFNLSTINDQTTPRLIQNRIVTTYESVGGIGAALRPEGWVLTVIFIALGGSLIILATRRKR